MSEEQGWVVFNTDGTVSLDGSGVKILRLLEPQGEPDIIECDGMRYMPERTCKWTQWDQHSDEYFSTECGREFQWATPYDLPDHCPGCGAKVVE